MLVAGAVVVAAAVAVAGCAGGHKPAPVTPASVAPAPAVRLAWLPVEPLALPAVAAAINERLGTLKIPGVTASFRAAVSLEVAQLTIECIEPTPACYTAVGRSLGGDRLLWAEIERDPASDESVRVALVLFDVSGGAGSRRVARTFEGAEAARDGVAALFDHAFETVGTPGAAAAPAAPVAEGRAP